MTEGVEGGTALAWRLLATLEGGSLVLAASALVAYSARRRLVRQARTRRAVRTVLLTNVSNSLAVELKTQLESHGCVVSTVPSGTISGAMNTADIAAVDALIVVGADTTPKASGLEAMADVVSEEVYHNLKNLESLSALVKRGGCIAWASTGSGVGGRYSDAADALDTVLKANLQRVALLRSCEAVWGGRGEDAAARLLSALLTTNHPSHNFSIRNAAHKVGEYVGRWLKIVT